jgi:DNA-binding transcriptional LysR family regulator
MELRTLKYLLSLSECGSFTAAARRHFVTQPAVSIQLAKLQEELGVRLFELEGRKVRFTGAGERVLDCARRVVHLERQMLMELSDMDGMRKGAISIGTIDAASIYVLPAVFSSFRRTYPGIDIKVEVGSTLPLVRGIEDGRFDLAVGTIGTDTGDGIEVFEVFREQLVPIADPLHPILKEGKRRIDSLAKYPFISFHSESVTRRLIDEVLVGKGIKLEVAMAIDSQEAIKNLVAAGLGFSILPRATVEKEISSGVLEEIPVRGLKIERRIGLMIPGRRYLSRTTRAFLGIMNGILDLDLPAGLLEPQEVTR